MRLRSTDATNPTLYIGPLKAKIKQTTLYIGPLDISNRRSFGVAYPGTMQPYLGDWNGLKLKSKS
jgi:hypothetical protein